MTRRPVAELPWDADTSEMTAAERAEHEYRVQRRAVAIHEVGHAVIGIDNGLFCLEAELYDVRRGIFNRKRITHGRTEIQDGELAGADAHFAQLCACLGGPLAEATWVERELGIRFAKAFKLANTADDRAMARSLDGGFGVLRRARSRARAQVDRRWPAIERLAEELDRRGKLDGDQILTIGGRAMSRASRRK